MCHKFVATYFCPDCVAVVGGRCTGVVLCDKKCDRRIPVVEHVDKFCKRCTRIRAEYAKINEERYNKRMEAAKK